MKNAEVRDHYFWSEEDQVFVAEVPELPGCMGHGDTQESALTNAKEAIQLWVDTAREFGDPILEPKGRQLGPPVDACLITANVSSGAMDGHGGLLGDMEAVERGQTAGG